MLDTTMTSFNSSSVTGDQRCFVLDPVQDTIVENDETMSFEARVINEQDVFVDEENSFSLVIRDDDGKLYVKP